MNRYRIVLTELCSDLGLAKTELTYSTSKPTCSLLARLGTSVLARRLALLSLGRLPHFCWSGHQGHETLYESSAEELRQNTLITLTVSSNGIATLPTWEEFDFGLWAEIAQKCGPSRKTSPKKRSKLAKLRILGHCQAIGHFLRCLGDFKPMLPGQPSHYFPISGRPGCNYRSYNRTPNAPK